MRNKKLLMLTTILAISSINSFSLAEETTADQIAKQPSAAVASHSENVVLEYSARKILGYASEARVALDNKQKDLAIAYIDDALSEMDKIRNTQNFLETIGVQLGKVRYGEANSYYIPIADDAYAVRTYAKGPFWSANKTTAVKDVELTTVDISISPDKSTAHLQSAKNKINADDYMGASNELKDMLGESIRETTNSVEPFIKLQDNIYLTRILIRQQNFDGARYTLKHAKDALSDYKTTVTSPERQANVSSLSKEIDELDNTIKKNNPTLLQKSERKVDKWWKDLKSWVKK